MKAHEINIQNNELVELVSDDALEFDKKIVLPAEVDLLYEYSMDQFILTLDNRHWLVSGRDDRNQELLHKIGEKNMPKICWLVSQFPGNDNKSILLIQINEFPVAQSWGEELIQFGIDEKIIEQVRIKHFRSFTEANQVCEWLFQEAIIEPGIHSIKHRIIVSVGSKVQTGLQTAFRVHGKSIDIDIRQQEDRKLRVERIVYSRAGQQDKNPLYMIEGSFSFCDISVAGTFIDARKNEVDRLVERADSYMKLWREFNVLERDQFIRKARRFGYYNIARRIQLPDGTWRFDLHRSEKVINALLELNKMETPDIEVSDVLPSELINPDQYDVQDSITSHQTSSLKQCFAGKFIASDPIKCTIDLRAPVSKEDLIPPEQGVIHLALTGDRTRLERRDNAEMRIRSMSNPMKQLVFILEGQIVPTGRRKCEKAYSPAAVERFDGPPTQVQMQALDIALNTPDIAVIQGPPGTGKTRVIAALEVRLAEINKERELARKTLLTSYQHDAVAYAASKTLVFDIPAIKVGIKSDQNKVEDGVEEWRKKRIELLEASLSQLPDRPASQVYRQVKNLVIGYRKAPTPPEQTIPLLEKIAQISADFISPDLIDQLRILRNSLIRGYGLNDDDQKEERDLALRALKALRINPQAFLDDGAGYAKKTLHWLFTLKCLSAKDEELLKRAANWDQDKPPAFLPELEELKNRLIDYIEETTRLAGTPLANEDITNLLNQWCDSLYNSLRDSTEGPDSVVSDYLDDLINDPYGIRSGIQEYTAVLAATCQQSDSDDVAKIKDKEPFESVIIDEAARANPLDLFIPMSMAERRIILVGDHRQLPQVLEPEIEKLLEQSVQEQTQKAISESLFERLFRQLKRQTDTDGISRTITLNVQYRMHHLLGDFLSRVFYEPYGEGFSSGKSDEEFAHNNPIFKNKVAGWVNIPLSRGTESRGKSKYRTVEAEWIAKNIKAFMDSDPDFTFGIISFYAAQVKEILKKLYEQDIAEKLDSGGYQVKKTYEQRLQVDTVDAYQGKEFDVVILSMTRSNDVQSFSNKELRKKYGFLMLPNRLCVAMSRQKSLLIVVGDYGMIENKAAADAVPGLVEFRKLCDETYGKLLQY